MSSVKSFSQYVSGEADRAGLKHDAFGECHAQDSKHAQEEVEKSVAQLLATIGRTAV